MHELTLLGLVVIASAVLLATGKWLEGVLGRPGLGMGMGAGLVLVAALVALNHTEWWLSGILFVQAVIFLSVAWRRRSGSE